MDHMVLGLSMWQALAIIGVVLIISELLVGGFVLLPIGLAFLVTAGFSAFITNWSELLTLLAFIEVGTFFIFKKYLGQFRVRTSIRTNAGGMVGQECVVVEPIVVGESGYVKLYGDLWSARSCSQGDIKKGDHVVIVKIDGNKVVVEPMNVLED